MIIDSPEVTVPNPCVLRIFGLHISFKIAHKNQPVSQRFKLSSCSVLFSEQLELLEAPSTPSYEDQHRGRNPLFDIISNHNIALLSLDVAFIVWSLVFPFNTNGSLSQTYVLVRLIESHNQTRLMRLHYTHRLNNRGESNFVILRYFLAKTAPVKLILLNFLCSQISWDKELRTGFQWLTYNEPDSTDYSLLSMLHISFSATI